MTQNGTWQFYGLVDEVAAYDRALDADDIRAAASGRPSGEGPFARCTFDNEFPTSSDRPVTVPTASDTEVADFVNPRAEHPLPVYYVEVSGDSETDRGRFDYRPSVVGVTVPFCAGEWWQVSQGWQDPAGSHNGDTKHTGFVWDFVRVDGQSKSYGSTVLAAAPGRVSYAQDQSTMDVDQGNSLTVIHTRFERAVYMHIRKDSFRERFPGVPSNGETLPVPDQPRVGFLQPLCEDGNPAQSGPHLHFAVSAQNGPTFAEAGPGVPSAARELLPLSGPRQDVEHDRPRHS